MLKIVATITNFAAAAHIGGDVERSSEIINVPTKNIPPNLKRYLSHQNQKKWETLSFSLLEEEGPCPR